MLGGPGPILPLRDCFHPLSGWQLHREESGVKFFRICRDLGPAQIHVGAGILLVFERQGVKEWDRYVMRRWVEVTRVGFCMGPGCPVRWYH